MKPISSIACVLGSDELAALARAKRALETRPLAMKLASAVGAPIERLMERLPAVAHDTIASATRVALDKCLQAALASVSASPGEPERKSRDIWHKLAVATTGAAGGAFGLIALPAELPVTTTLMFRSICDIARSEGEDLRAAETRLECLSVFGLGGLSGPGGLGHAAARADEDADFGYFVARGALAQAVSKASSELASKSVASHSAPALLRLINTIAARFSVQVSEQVAAKSIPAIGAVLGVLVNTAFIDHFQQTAHGHFTVRRLERRYGTEPVEAAYRAIDLASVT
ncbi:EcsC family protein [Trinickia sp. LjRoot230]|uniref:EcsC family protein n=1 Tax=Trinickia sp. LjRoot230 TaxID=3342288 RepID=UPI003ECDB677